MKQEPRALLIGLTIFTLIPIFAITVAMFTFWFWLPLQAVFDGTTAIILAALLGSALWIVSMVLLFVYRQRRRRARKQFNV